MLKTTNLPITFPGVSPKKGSGIEKMLGPSLRLHTKEYKYAFQSQELTASNFSFDFALVGKKAIDRPFFFFFNALNDF